MVQKKLVLVTGGVKGIGKMIAITFKDKGYDVIVSYKSSIDQAKQIEQEYDIKPYQCDVSQYDESQNMINEITEKYGKNIDILINNAGISGESIFFHKMRQNMWHDVINNNLISCFNVSNLVLPGMRDAQFGRLINISSIHGQNGGIGVAHYAASKAAMIGFTQSVAKENASKNITVNCIAPGYVDTDLIKNLSPEVKDNLRQNIPMKRFATTEEIAACAAYLASDEAAFITGAVIPVNGGQNM